MSLATTALRGFARLVVASDRARYREEWLSDLQHCAEMGIAPSQIVWAALRVSVTTAQRKRFSMCVSPTVIAQRGLLTLTAAAILFVCATLVGFSAFEFALFATSAAVGLVGCGFLARSAALVIQNRWAPWFLFATLAAGTVLAAVSLVQINALFASNESSNPIPGTGATLAATGVVGVIVLLCAGVFLAMVAVGLISHAQGRLTAGKSHH